MTTNKPGTVTDRELIQLAAKAAGYKVRWHENWQCFVHANPHNIDNPPTMSGQRLVWVPLEDDGDALRLAVKLDIHFKSVSASLFSSAGYAVNEIRMDYIHEPHGNDPYAATRRAIVRAAASIGKDGVRVNT